MALVLKKCLNWKKVYQEYKNKEDFAFLSMTSPSDAIFKNVHASDETREVILAKAKKLNITYPILFDVNDRFIINYNIRSFPTHIFINSDGSLSSQAVGMFNENKLKEQLEKLK